MTANTTAAPPAGASGNTAETSLPPHGLKPAAGTTKTATASGQGPEQLSHPLGPLSGSEITRSSALIRGAWPAGTLFQFKVVTLLEPAKAAVVPYLAAQRKGETPAESIDRRAFVVYYIKNTVGPQPRPHLN